jgi:hypothetical protein
MSPGEFELSIGVYDSAGHVEAVGKLGHDCYGVNGRQGWCEINFAISVDPSLLTDMVRQFREISTGQFKPDGEQA